MSYERLAMQYDALMFDCDYGAWAGYLLDLLKKAGVQPGGHVLEYACGTGNLTSRLAKYYRVTAVDQSEEMLSRCLRKLCGAGVSARCAAGDMRSFAVGEQADAVVCAMDGVNYLAQPRDFFANAYRNLREGGALLFDITGGEALRARDGEVYFDDAEDATCLWTNEFAHGALNIEVILFEKQGGVYTRSDESHVLHAHTIEGLERDLSAAGFGNIKALRFGGGQRAAETDERVQFCAAKYGNKSS